MKSFGTIAYRRPAKAGVPGNHRSNCPLWIPAFKRVIQSARADLGAAQADGIFPATRENTGRNSVCAQNVRNSSQIDPCNQVLIIAFPMRLAGKEFSLPGMPAGNWQGKSRKWCGSAARPAARRTDCPCSSGRRHVATLAQIIRVNLDAKMAGFHRRKGRVQTSSHDWITASFAGMTNGELSCVRSSAHIFDQPLRAARVASPLR